MTELDFTAKYERVLTALGIWRRGEFQCMYHMPCHGDQSGEHQGFRRIPPPELTDAVAWRCVVAAANKMLRSEVAAMDEFHPENWGCTVSYDGGEEVGRAYGKTPERALILALAEALA